MADAEPPAPDVDEAAEGEEKAPAPTHEPFDFPILPLISTAQSQNGLRHHDHHRYRKYCYRRLQRVRKGLKFHHGRGRFKAAALPDFFSQPKYLELPLVAADRAWAYGMQIKEDNASAAKPSSSMQAHAVRRFAKAVKLAEELVAQVEKHCDARSQKEAAAYLAFLRGTLQVERSNWTEAHAALQECQAAYEHLALMCDAEAAPVYRTKVKDLAPLIRQCTYHLGVDTQANADTAGDAATADMTVVYRGTRVPVANAELQAAVADCGKAVDDVDPTAPDAMEKFGVVANVIEEALKKVHAAMLNNEDGASLVLKQLESYLRELTICSNAERSLVLLQALEQTMSLADQKKSNRPEEGVRLCDICVDELKSLKELADAEALEPGLQGLQVALRNIRLLYVSLVHASMGKVAESVALFDLLRTRLDDVPEAPCPSLERTQKLLADATARLQTLASTWRSRILAQYVLSQNAEAEPVVEAASAGFPPKVAPIACKPFVLDLAHPELETPSFAEVIQKKAGLMSKVGGRLGKVAGWFGR